MNEKDMRWNRFIYEICDREPDTLSDIQRKAVLCFRYDSEMNSGGYSGFMDSFPDTDPEELAAAIEAVGSKEIADNYIKAVTVGESDDWSETDDAYYGFLPSLCDLLQNYVEANKEVIFE